ncbi:hypothetical protein PRZ48_005778 [Zasmidium cellare]|uniref:Uncharacterized protein n=1 Tax=Zasmidium cellare TaxID=395010 RepID=A0ABR0EMC1_ZASCE|nr:hypothetical protein PRZ48_005778 [Zasmidium cellare]
MKRLRRDMQAWLNGPGKVFREPLPGSTNYMAAYDKQGKLLRTKRNQGEEGPEEDAVPLEKEPEIRKQEEEDGLDEQEMQKRYEQREFIRQRKAERDARGGLPRERPFDMRPYPLNQNFRSQPVLSEDLREVIYQQVAVNGVDVSTVSAAFSVDTRRVAAVVRLKTIEKQWIEENKPLAKPYQDAVMAMLPQTPYRPNIPGKMIPHETINDLPVHPKTRQQIFYPVSESRQFTREDAAKAFDEKLLPADERIAHPELIAIEKDTLAGLSREERFKRQQERDRVAAEAKAEQEEKRRKWEEKTQRVVPGRRWDFKFQDFSAEKVGKTGRARNAIGVRYGMPHEDRKRGMVKIPTSVE